MARIKVKGFDKKHKAIVESKTTPVLITELIARFPVMCEADIKHSLEEIRKSAEQDEDIRRIYARALKLEKCEGEGIVVDGIDALKKCVEEYGDMEIAIAILRLCKTIAGDKLKATLE